MGKHCVEGMRRVGKRVEYLSSGLEPLRGGYREGVGGGDRERILTVTIDTELRAWIGNYTHAQLGGCGHSRFSRAIQAAVEVCTASTLPVKRRFHLRRNTPAIQGANSVG